MTSKTKDMLTASVLFDRRVVERNIRKGAITREDYTKVLGALPDRVEQAELIKARLGEPDEDFSEDLDDEDDEDDAADE